MARAARVTGVGAVACGGGSPGSAKGRIMNTMRTSRLIPVTAVAALAALALTASPALADGGSGHSILRADLVGSMPAPDSPVIAGINPGGAPWVNGPSSARVRDDMLRPSTAPFALSTAGDGATSGRISGTHRCKDPVLLIQPAGNRTVYI